MLQRPLGGKRLFDCDFPAAWKKIPKCVVCAAEFSVIVNPAHFYNKLSSTIDAPNDQFRKNKNFPNKKQELSKTPARYKTSRRPLVLDCSHNVCEQCVFNNRTGHLFCKECQTSSPINRNRPIRERFELNYHLNGLISYIEYNLQRDLSHPLLAREIESSPKQDECSECNEGNTNHLCMQCNVPYCKDCFTKVHKLGRALQKHSLVMREKKSILVEKDYNKRCMPHKRYYDRYCISCATVVCGICVMKAHGSHEIICLTDENKQFIPKINSLIETVKLAKEYNKQSQKEIRMLEKSYEDYASNTIEKVSKFFTSMHSIFQIMEKNILLDIKQQTAAPLKNARNALNTFVQAYASLEDMKNHLEDVITNPPNCLLSKIIERTNTKLEATACNIELEQIKDNPFNFVILKDAVKEVHRLVSLSSRTIPLKIKIMSFYGDKSGSDASEPEKDVFYSSFNLKSSTQGHSTKPVKSNSMLDQTIVLSQSLNISEYSSLPSVVNSQKVHVSHIKSPSHFFVQNQMFLSTVDDFKRSCAEEADYASIPDSIELNETYLVYNTADKGWYRGKVLQAISNNVYRVFLLDYGTTIQVGQQRFREVGSLRKAPNGAIECSVYGVKPTNGSWTDEASQLMAELIKNHLVTLIVVKNNDPQNLVDLVTTHSKYPTSLRDALLYTNLAVVSDTIDPDIKDRFPAAEEMKNSLIPVPSDRFYKNVFKERENFRVVMANIVNPQEFYVIKFDHKETLDKMQRELNSDTDEGKAKLFSPQQNMPCAVFVNGIWYRGRFIKSLGNGSSKVWLVDEGRHETINWSQIRALDEKFFVSSEFAIQCSLVDIEPLQDNDYSWTEEAVKEFKRIAKNPVLQIFVHRSKNFRYKVVLSIIKKTVDVNVNALLVSYNHAIASGPEAISVEFRKGYSKDSPKMNADEIMHIETSYSPRQKSPSSGLAKTKIKISHIVSPGEFYVHLVEHISGISRLHREIQIEQQKKGQPEKFRNDWEVGENCLVNVSLKQEMQKEWFRGIIKDSDCSESTRTYTVFLTDHGHTLHGITTLQLAEIDKLFSRVCNGAVLCHLACVQPTGGLDEWSYSSKDEFKNNTLSYEAFGATIQGKRKNNSIPIILWGMTTAYSDPFKADICKWVNINKSLMNCGLAHLVEKFDPALQKEGTLSNELQEGQETLEQWIEFLNKRLSEPNNEPLDFMADKTIDLDFCDEICDGELKSWPSVRVISKSVFTAYPTYVDNDATVYLHDAIDHSLLEAMKEVIETKMKDTKPVENLYWYSGQPCMARYHLDNKFYRAVVVETKPNQIISVQFIDYGNMEECTTADLRAQIMMEKIPIIANKYHIDGIIPKDGDDTWSVATLDFIHSQLVGKLCTIRVSPNEENNAIKKCSIKVGTIDIAELLWISGRADKGEVHREKCEFDNTNKSSQKKSTLCDKTELERQNKSISDSDSLVDLKPPNHVNLPEKDHLDPDELKIMFEKKELENLYKSITIPSNDSDEDMIELEYSFQQGYWDDDEKAEENAPKREIITPTSSMSFNPKETSSLKSHLRESGTFMVPKLPHGITKFYGEVTYVQNSTNLYVAPFLVNFENRFKDMAKQIQNIVNTCQKLDILNKDTPCLAKYAADQLWYRAIIRSYRSDIEKADVLFVDFLNAELVTKDMIKVCPDHLIEYPLRNLVVKLSGLKPNPRLRESDIQSKLSDILCEYKKIFVKIKKIDTVPEVEIFSSQNSVSVIYSELIEQRYYLKD